MVFIKRAKEKESTRFHRNVVTIARVLNSDGSFCNEHYAEIRSDRLPEILSETYKKVESLDFRGPVMTFVRKCAMSALERVIVIPLTLCL